LREKLSAELLQAKHINANEQSASSSYIALNNNNSSNNGFSHSNGNTISRLFRRAIVSTKLKIQIARTKSQ
jgi:hypothetical protein